MCDVRVALFQYLDRGNEEAAAHSVIAELLIRRESSGGSSSQTAPLVADDVAQIVRAHQIQRDVKRSHDLHLQVGFGGSLGQGGRCGRLICQLSLLFSDGNVI